MFGDGNGMFDLTKKLPSLLVDWVFYDNHEIVRVETVDLALKFDFRNRPAGKTGGVPAGEHQCDKRCLYVRFKMKAATSS